MELEDPRGVTRVRGVGRGLHYWHKADIDLGAEHVCIGVKMDIPDRRAYVVRHFVIFSECV